MCSERLLWCRRLTWGPHCQDITEANSLVRLFVTWELSFYECAYLSWFLRICSSVTWHHEYLYMPNRRGESKTLKLQTTPRREKSRVKFCHSNFFFVAGLLWPFKIITLKQVIRGSLLIPSLEIQPEEFAEKFMMGQLGRHENIFLHSGSAWFLLHFCLDFVQKGSFHACGN